MINPVLTRAALPLVFLVAFSSMGHAYTPIPHRMKPRDRAARFGENPLAAIDSALGNAMNWA